MIEGLVLFVWLIAGLAVGIVNCIMFFVIARNWSLFVRWKKSQERELAEGISKIVVDKITNPELEDVK